MPDASSRSRAGRNLPVAILVAIVLYAWILGTLLWLPWGFIVFLVCCVIAGGYEVTTALSRVGMYAWYPAIAVGGTITIIAAYAVSLSAGQAGGALVMLVGICLSAAVALMVRLRGKVSGFIRDGAASLFALTYVVALMAPLALLLAQPHGNLRVVFYFLMIPCSDTAAYAVGMLLGKHKLAPHISPGKTWEGFAGAVILTTIAAALIAPPLIDATWWAGAIIGALLAVFGACGDLVESMIKRDAGIKDMGRILPGHGGAMDRLDSLLLAAPIAWMSMLVLV